MNNFGTLYTYELKKIFQKKIVWVSLAIMVALTVVMSLSGILFSAYSLDGQRVSAYDFMAMNRDMARLHSGKAVDDTLLKEMQKAYEGHRTVTTIMTSDTGTETTVSTGTSSSKDREKYNAIYRLAMDILNGDEEALLSVTANELYETRSAGVLNQMDSQKLTESEFDYWQTRESQLEIPLVFDYTRGYSTLLSEISLINILLLLLTAICLSSVFSDEHLRRTDQLILSSRLGRKQLYLAKIAAGATFGTASAVLLYAAAAVSAIAVYGTDGAGAAIQLIMPTCSWPLTIGQTALIYLGVLIVASLLYSVAAMFLSELLKSSVSTMAVMVGITLLTLFLNVPDIYRLPSQIYSFFPTQLVTLESLWDRRLVALPGAYLANWQFGPVVYLIIAVVLTLVGQRIYRRYQVSGR